MAYGGIGEGIGRAHGRGKHQPARGTTRALLPAPGRHPLTHGAGVSLAARSRPRPRAHVESAPPPFAQIPAQYGLGDSEDELGQFGFSLHFKKPKFIRNIQRAVTKAGHQIGTVVTSKVGQGILGTALAVTGVGAPAAAAIFAGSKGLGNLIKPGGNLKHFATGAAQGAVEGVAAAGAGRVVRRAISAVRGRGAGSAQQAAAQQVAQRAQVKAEESRRTAAEQVADAAAQVAIAQATGNDAAAQDAQDAQEQYNAQLAAATQAAQAAQAANQAIQDQGATADPGLLSQLASAAAQAAGVADAAAQAPPTPQATQQVQQGAADVGGYVGDLTSGAVDGTPQEAGILGDLGNISPVVLIGGVALLALMTAPKKRGGGRRRSSRRRR